MFKTVFSLLLVLQAALLAVVMPLATSSETTTAGGIRPDDKSGKVKFNRDIRPLLSDRCFQCHGFDGNQRKADLRLDSWEGLTAELLDGHPVVPGKPSASEIVRRIEHADPDEKMPPADSGLSLNAGEIALIRRWIEEGAEFEPHWAYTPVTSTDRPTTKSGSWTKNPVDEFILRTLESSGLQPSPQADRETLIRRLSLDLTGLPPTPEETDSFLADKSPTAYEDLVNRLLDSPRYGERMALMWLDAARYADTNGFHHDNARTIWPYRNWVISAFNRNLPYDRFLTEQIAGDLLEEPTEDQLIASAFCRMHNINDEGGALDAEYRVEAVVDRMETVATVVMGLTFTCARCHDHKYDPITQEDYYSLYAYFNSIDERGVYGANFEQARAYPARLLYEPDDLKERRAGLQAKLDATEIELGRTEPQVASELAAWEKGIRTQLGMEWVATEAGTASCASAGTLEPLPDGSLRFKGAVPAKDSHTFTFTTEATGMRLLQLESMADPSFPEGRVGLAHNGNAVISSVSLEAISQRDPTRKQQVDWSWAWADFEQPNADYDIHNLLREDALGWALGGHLREGGRTSLFVSNAPFGFEGGTEIRVTVSYRSVYAKHIAGRTRISFAKTTRDLEGQFPVVSSPWYLAGPFKGGDFDALFEKGFGPETVTSLDLNQAFGGKKWANRADIVDGKALALNAQQSAYYFGRTIRTPVERKMHLSLGSDDAIRVFLNGNEVLANKVARGVLPDQEKLDVTLPPGENVLVVKIVNNGGPGGFYYKGSDSGDAPGPFNPVALTSPDRRDPLLARQHLNNWGREKSKIYAPLLDRTLEIKSEMAELEKEVVPVLYMKELAKPTPTFVLTRGQYNAADKNRPVSRRPPLAFGGKLPEGSPDNRLGLVQWFLHQDHPLTSRVHVNRIWQMLFGTGLVETSENFGHQAKWPSHLELLDWMAAWFMDSGWDQKELIRLVVSSATYRQSAVTDPVAARVDPPNRLLSHFPRQRLPGEFIRDQALHVSGLLVEKLGGPSVKPYQPMGLWREVSIGGSSNTQIFRRDEGTALYRRSLYTFWKRTSPNPQMSTFDAPTREFCVVRRSITNTPLQALVIWNDIQFVEAARALAQRTIREAKTRRERLSLMFRRATGRRPGNRELAILTVELEQFRKRYRSSPKDAAALVSQGESKPYGDYNASDLAAWTMVANTVLSLDETLVRD